MEMVLCGVDPEAFCVSFLGWGWELSGFAELRKAPSCSVQIPLTLKPELRAGMLHFTAFLFICS